MPEHPTPPPAVDDRWLSLGPASRLLGVDPDTLRRWADDGRLDAWTTPGGHRRFERRALERLASDRRRGAALRPLASLGATPARIERVYRRHYADSPQRLDPAVAADDPERDAFRRDGRLLVASLITYLDARADPVGRERAEAAADAIVDAQGARLASSGTSLTESVGLFVAARRPFLAEIARLGQRRSLDPGRLAALYEDASSVLDRLLLRFIQAHQGAAAPEASTNR